MAMLKTFMRGDLSALVESAKKIRQNRLTHSCVALLNCLGNSNESPKKLQNIAAYRNVLILNIISRDY